MREEVSQLNNSLIVVASGDEYEMLYPIVAAQENWNKEYQKKYGIWWIHDQASGNTYVHTYHPRVLRTWGIFDEAANTIVRIAQQTLPPFQVDKPKREGKA